MPRPCKHRRVCAEPVCGCFGPRDAVAPEAAPVVMTLDEFESIRLIDLEGMTQEQCARQMDVARTTAQAIYTAARVKLAECLVHARQLRIEGGQYRLCEGRSTGCCGRPCRRFIREAADEPQRKQEESRNMTIAVTYDNGQIFQHFGRTERFKVYEIADGRVQSAQVVEAGGVGHGALAGLLAQSGVDALICGGIGGGAQMALADAGIRLYGGASGDADHAVEALLNGTLAFDAHVQCDHHGAHHEGGCGHHGGSCGGHGCGE